MKRSDLPQSRRHILMFDEDWEWLHANFGPHSVKAYGVGAAVREIVHAHVRRLRARVTARLDDERPGAERSEPVSAEEMDI